MTEFTRIRKRSLSVEIVDEIKRMIQEGQLPTNQQLPTEKELSEMFGVGRSSVREALTMLAAAEIIEKRPGEGTFVRKVDMQNYIHPLALSIVNTRAHVIHLLETRELIELGMVQLAATRADEKDLLKMKKAMLDYEMELDDAKLRKEYDFNFHQAIAYASKNPTLIKVVDNISQLMVQCIKYAISKNTGIFSDRKKDVVIEHQQIFESIENKDAEGAKKAMEIHFEEIRKVLLNNEYE